MKLVINTQYMEWCCDMDKEELIWKVIDQIKEDIRVKDDMPLYGLLEHLSQQALENFLPDFS